jgi:hypothetical protein
MHKVEPKSIGPFEIGLGGHAAVQVVDQQPNLLQSGIPPRVHPKPDIAAAKQRHHKHRREDYAFAHDTSVSLPCIQARRPQPSTASTLGAT